MNFFRYVFQKHWYQIVAAILVFVGVLYLASNWAVWHQKLTWVDPIIGFGTLLFAFFLWLNDLRHKWEDSLPKRVTVQFQYGGRNVMVCYDALLTNLADARAWALQIGQQMSGSQRLSFEPFYYLNENGIQWNQKHKKQFKSYVFTFYLKQLPLPDNVSEQEKENFKRDLEMGCFEWIPEYHSDGTISVGKGYNPLTSQKMIITN